MQKMKLACSLFTSAKARNRHAASSIVWHHGRLELLTPRRTSQYGTIFSAGLPMARTTRRPIRPTDCGEDPASMVRFRRDVGSLFSFIKASAILHQAQRRKTARRVVATLADYAVAYPIFSKVLAQSSGQSVTDNVRCRCRFDSRARRPGPAKAKGQFLSALQGDRRGAEVDDFRRADRHRTGIGNQPRIGPSGPPSISDFWSITKPGRANHSAGCPAAVDDADADCCRTPTRSLGRGPLERRPDPSDAVRLLHCFTLFQCAWNNQPFDLTSE